MSTKIIYRFCLQMAGLDVAEGGLWSQGKVVVDNLSDLKETTIKMWQFAIIMKRLTPLEKCISETKSYT